MAISIRHGITHKETSIGRKLETYKFLLHFNNLLDYFVAVRQLHFCPFRGQCNSWYFLHDDVFRAYRIFWV